MGHGELYLASILLSRLAEGTGQLVNSPMCSKGLQLGYNQHSGDVYLHDEDGHCWMENNGKIEEWLTCYNCGAEAFETDREVFFAAVNRDTCRACTEEFPF